MSKKQNTTCGSVNMNIPASRENENCGTLTPTFPHPLRTSTGSTFSPIITRVAMATKSKSSVLETNGNERDTRTLHSITFSSLSYKTKGKYDNQGHFLTYYCTQTWFISERDTTHVFRQ